MSDFYGTKEHKNTLNKNVIIFNIKVKNVES